MYTITGKQANKGKEEVQMNVLFLEWSSVKGTISAVTCINNKISQKMGDSEETCKKARSWHYN